MERWLKCRIECVRTHCHIRTLSWNNWKIVESKVNTNPLTLSFLFKEIEIVQKYKFFCFILFTMLNVLSVDIHRNILEWIVDNCIYWKMTFCVSGHWLQQCHLYPYWRRFHANILCTESCNGLDFHQIVHSVGHSGFLSRAYSGTGQWQSTTQCHDNRQD